MPIILQEALRGLFYAPFYVALARDAVAAEGVEIELSIEWAGGFRAKLEGRVED